jgi:palmitoyltransferase
MTSYCYWFSCKADPGYAPLSWRPPPIDVERGVAHVDSVLIDYGLPPGFRPRFCTKCRSFKPPRAHHCRVCGRCVLRMDHHCPFVDNCVGLRNHKQFMLLLFYAALLICFSYYLFAGRTLFADADVGPIDLALIAGLSVVQLPLLVLVVGLLSQHLELLARNLTTIESIELLDAAFGGPADEADDEEAARGGGSVHRHRRGTNPLANMAQSHPYDVGRLRNAQSLLGTSPLLWLCPVGPNCDGTRYSFRLPSGRVVQCEAGRPDEEDEEDEDEKEQVVAASSAKRRKARKRTRREERLLRAVSEDADEEATGERVRESDDEDAEEEEEEAEEEGEAQEEQEDKEEEEQEDDEAEAEEEEEQEEEEQEEDVDEEEEDEARRARREDAQPPHPASSV